MLEHPDLRPNTGHVSENGDVLVWWSLTGVRLRDSYRCRYPVVLTWVPYPAWRGGARPADVRAWLLADGMREVLPTSSGFYLGHSHCDDRVPGDQAPALGLDHQGHLRTVRTSSTIDEPRQAAIWTGCGPPRGGSCQFDPATNTLLQLPWRYSWVESWDEQRSILHRPSTHISGTWSVDGGSTWNQFIDVWDATPVRRGAATVAVSNGVMSNGLQSSFGELTGGSFREGYVEWSPEDAAPMTPLPRSVDGYRSWLATPSGSLLGIGRRGAYYVSDGRNWSDVTRQEAPDCMQGPVVIGDFLVCGTPGRSYPEWPAHPVLQVRVSDDLGGTWSTIRLDDVVPADQDQAR